MENTQTIYSASLGKRIRLILSTKIGLVCLAAMIIGFWMWLPNNIVITITLRDANPIIQTTETTTIVDSCNVASANMLSGFITVMPYKAKVIPEPVKVIKPKLKPKLKPVIVVKQNYYLLHSFNATNLSQRRSKSYIKRFYKTAQAEHKKYGIPASVTLAQGLLESGKGFSTLAVTANNHFGIKCFKRNCHEDHCMQHSDDKPTDRFYVYSSAWYSYRAHSKFLMRKRYKPCHKFKTYQSWCDCLKEKGYATDPQYHNKLKQLIRDYKLYQFDSPQNYL